MKTNICFCWTLAIALCTAAATHGSDPVRGEAVFKEQCASCHGLDGQGTRDKYNEPLAGDLSITELAKVIDETMPEGEPEKSSQKIRLPWLRTFIKRFTRKWRVSVCARRESNWRA